MKASFSIIMPILVVSFLGSFIQAETAEDSVSSPRVHRSPFVPLQHRASGQLYGGISQRRSMPAQRYSGVQPHMSQRLSGQMYSSPQNPMTLPHRPPMQAASGNGLYKSRQRVSGHPMSYPVQHVRQRQRQRLMNPPISNSDCLQTQQRNRQRQQMQMQMQMQQPAQQPDCQQSLARHGLYPSVQPPVHPIVQQQQLIPSFTSSSMDCGAPPPTQYSSSSGMSGGAVQPCSSSSSNGGFKIPFSSSSSSGYGGHAMQYSSSSRHGNRAMHPWRRSKHGKGSYQSSSSGWRRHPNSGSQTSGSILAVVFAAIFSITMSF